MVSLISFIWDLIQPNRIIRVERMPGNKGLRAHLLGLTAGLLLVAPNLVHDPPTSSWAAATGVLLWFMLTTYYSGLFFFITFIAFILLNFLGWGGGFWHLFANLCHWYFLGYAAGAVLGILYNDLLYLFMLLFEEDKIKIAFAYDPTKKINIIKSPKPGEEHAMDRLLARKPHLRKRRLYQYKFAPPPPAPQPPAHPYTIAFIANPKIRKRGGAAEDEAGYEKDPILRNRDLFLHAVDRALSSFENDPVIGRPEIWSRIRVITVFNPSLAEAPGPQFGMVEEFQQEGLSEQDGTPVENNLLDPMAGMHANFTRILNQSRGGETNVFDENDVDVIFAITASRSHDRSASHLSDWTEELDASGLRNRDGVRRGNAFTFDYDPAGNKPAGTILPTLHEADEINAANVFRKVHDYCAMYAGRVALNVLGARQKTFVHEFAHAMSSAMHGAITDEYVDCFVLPQVGSAAQCDQTPLFIVNRIDRDFSRMISGQPLPVPKIFAEYNHTRYDADLDHPSAEEGWTGYFPDKFADSIPCTMDADYGGHRFDELLSAFIYDRLMAKVTRPQKCAHEKTTRATETEPAAQAAEAARA